ncbi:MAG TPA: hypothetical protein VHY08_13430 [Bacillota bacterium]|nr:hypothetical protein [Bacillota bacterium]
MKMGFLFSSVFWGVVLVLWGCALVLNVLFHLNIPVFRILIALIIIFWGIQLLFGWKGKPWYYSHSDDHNIIFGQSTKNATPLTKDYNFIFSNGDLNVTEPNPEWINSKLEVNTIFGSSVMKINPEIPAKIVTTAAFGHIITPDNQQSVMGDHVYQTPALKENQPYLLIKATVVFGNMEVKLQRTDANQPESI